MNDAERVAETPGDLYLVLTAYEDPHPHIEGVFTDEDAARELLADCAAVVGGPNPLAWSLVRVNEHGCEVLEP